LCCGNKRVFWYRTRILKARVSSPIWSGRKKKPNLNGMNPNEMARGTSNERVEESGTRASVAIPGVR